MVFDDESGIEMLRLLLPLRGTIGIVVGEGDDDGRARLRDKGHSSQLKCA